MKALLTLAIAAAAVGAVPAAAQTIDPGMTREEVEGLLGKPVGVRSTGTHVYLFYRNGCEERCGMQDLVILENDGVVDAIFRNPSRKFSGASSSPTGVKPEATVGERASQRGDRGGIIVAPTRGDTTAEAVPTPPRATPTAGAAITTPTQPRTTMPAATAPATIPSTTVTGNPGAETRPTMGPGGVPLNPADTITVRPAPANPTLLMPATPQSAPVPNAGAKPSPSDSARAARGTRPDTTRKP